MSSASVPLQFAAVARNGRVTLTWQMQAPGTTFSVYRAPHGQTPTLYQAGVLTQPWTDFAAANGTAYDYALTATLPAPYGGDGVESAACVDQTAQPGPAAGTLYPFAQTLEYLLRWLVVADALAAVNARLAGLTAGGGSLALTPAQVITGDKRALAPDEIVICVICAQGQDSFLGTGWNALDLSTQIVLKVPKVLTDSAPEDYALVGSAFTDALRDLLAGKLNATLSSQDPATGRWLLPGQMAFTGCRMTGFARVSGLKGAEGVTEAVQWTVFHSASVQYPFDRPRPLGAA